MNKHILLEKREKNVLKKHSTIDITHKSVPTWYGGTKVVPTSKSEQRKMKAEILNRDPKAVVVDSNAKKKDWDWIDRIEEFDAFMD